MLDGKRMMDEVIEEMGDRKSRMWMKKIEAIAWDGDLLKGVGAIGCGYQRY
ncbi:hypothetical protein [Bacillus pumilus]|uniref:hypothetical protein n=1 Tax=Bacillus pumilus TaxID=1408 RepID=UPI00164247FC|nr:hypothetical protein [Bacillus pumilus]